MFKINELSNKRIFRYTVVATAVILFVIPDPFSDMLAFWLLAKIGCDLFIRKRIPVKIVRHDMRHYYSLPHHNPRC